MQRSFFLWAGALVVVVAGLCAGCSSESAERATAAVVGKAVEVGKGTARGVVAGVEMGRRDGESLDGARLVTTAEELEDAGGVEVVAVRTLGDGGEVEVELALRNDGAEPLRVSGVPLVALDDEGFVLEGRGPTSLALTVPPAARARQRVRFAGAGIGTLRVGARALDLPPIVSGGTAGEG